MLSVIFFSIVLLNKVIANSEDILKLQSIYDKIQHTHNKHIQKRDRFDWLNWWKPVEEPIVESFDFIIVGGGSAGSVIASRLSEVSQWEILLLEAGEDEQKIFEIPVIVSLLQYTKYNWGDLMEYEPGIGSGLRNNRLHWPHGKALGGTSVINYMIYTRGQPYDYDYWAAQGNPGWSYKDVLPYFIKSENSGLENADRNFHGTGGYLSVENVYASKIVDAFLEGGNELGLPSVDYHANVSIGISKIQATVLEGRRHSAAKAFLHPVRHRPNLHILTSALVTKLLINTENKQIYGVEYEHSGKTYRVGADKEVILSAGTLRTPQLLMLAGIGPEDHLNELNIPVIKNLKVGQNLQDHLTFSGLSFVTDQDVTFSVKQILNPINIRRYINNGTGPLSCIGGAQAISYIKTIIPDDIEDTRPDIELLFVGMSLATDGGIIIRTEMGYTDEIYNDLFAPLENSNHFSIFPVLLHPKSRGYIKLRSKDPHDYPILHGNYFTDSGGRDMATFLTGIRFTEEFLKTQAFARFNVTLNKRKPFCCKKYQFDSDAYWRCAVKCLINTFHHQTGTAKMGPSDDPDAVVDNELKVYGIGRLRVADCSVIPFSLGAHTNAPAMMIGEKAADLIKKTWKVKLH